MERIFENYAPKYYEKGFIVTPAIGKRPYLKEWQNPSIYKDFEQMAIEHGARNIGVLLGEPSGIIAVDIDKDSSLDLCPLSPVRKKGAKGETRFFKYNGEINRKRMDLGLELLSTGNQTILPPSIHPDINKKYTWVTPDTLLDFDKNDLPILPESFLSLMENGQTNSSKITPSDGTRCEHGSHDILSKMVTAALHDGDDFGTILENLLEYDEKINPRVSYFLCPSRKEWKTKDRATNCLAFITQAAQRNVKVGAIEKVETKKVAINLINVINERKEQLERKPLPHLLGIGQELFKIAYDSSYVARSHFTFPAILSIASILMGNKISFQGVHPNIYCLLAGGSGSGKSSAMDFIKHFLQHFGLAEKLLGDGSPSGDTALMQNLPIQRERIDVIDEGDSLFLTINSINSYGKKLADTYASLFTSAGKVFLGKNSSAYKNKNNETGNVGGCFSPYVTMILGLTYKAFEQSVNELTIEKGFGARILYFADNEKKRKKAAKQIKIPQHIEDTVKMWMALEKIETNKSLDLTKNPSMKEFKVREAKINAENQQLLEKYLDELDEMNFKEPDDSKIISILSRSGEYFKKIALICAFFTQPHTTHLEITKECLDWAMEFTKVHLHNSKIFIEGHINQGQYNEKVNKVLNYIKNRNGVSKRDIFNAVRGIIPKERKEILKELIEMDQIKEVEKRYYFV